MAVWSGRPPEGGQEKGYSIMRIVSATNDPVRLSFLLALLADAGIEAVLLDQHASVMDGSIGAITRRLAVADADAPRARQVLEQAGEL